ncbi:MAG TPA: glycosyltransferase family 9 protein [Verrucomicrobiae bacterium]
MPAEPRTYRGRILVIRGGAIGDFILTLPAFAALRHQFPDAYLEVLGYPHIAQLAVAGGLVDHAQSIEARSLAGFFARNGDLSEDLAHYFSDFDLIISYLYDPDEIFRTNVGRCTPAQFIQGPHRPEPGCRVPAAEVYLQPLQRLAILEADPVPKLHIGPCAGAVSGATFWPGGEPPLKPVLALHPGSGSEDKNWPEARWAKLLESVVNGTGFNLLLVGGEAEGRRLQRLAAALPPTRTRVAQSLPLARLAALLSQCEGFIGHDSGISHLAAALGLPGLVLWAETDEFIWRPPSPSIMLIRSPAGLSRLPVETVFARLLEVWGARCPG